MPADDFYPNRQLMGWGADINELRRMWESGDLGNNVKVVGDLKPHGYMYRKYPGAPLAEGLQYTDPSRPLGNSTMLFERNRRLGGTAKGNITVPSTLAKELLKTIDERLRSAMPMGGGGSDSMGGVGSWPGRFNTRR